MTKNEKDIKLLQRAIVEKWLPIWKGKEEDEGGVNCSLCQEYTSCRNCPLFNEKKTYDNWRNHYLKYHRGRRGGKRCSIHCPECKRLAAEIVRWLREVRDTLALKEERKEERK